MFAQNVTLFEISGSKKKHGAPVKQTSVIRNKNEVSFLQNISFPGDAAVVLLAVVVASRVPHPPTHTCTACCCLSNTRLSLSHTHIHAAVAEANTAVCSLPASGCSSRRVPDQSKEVPTNSCDRERNIIPRIQPVAPVV